MTKKLEVISPVDESLYAERELADERAVIALLHSAKKAQQAWSKVPLEERAHLCTRFVDAFCAMKDEIVPELAWQMGRPVAFGAGEVAGFEERARAMIALAKEALSPYVPPAKEGFTRYIRREPLGVVLTISAWNYPYLIAVNSIVPALMAGNTVVLKMSHQTPLCAERLALAMEKAGAPDGIFQIVHMDHVTAAKAVAHPDVNYVAFTGSVSGGAAIERAATGRFIGVGLELGGKDPAYVRADANLIHAVEGLVDGAFFNSGQSCCGIERIYVHEKLYGDFVEAFESLTRQYVLGDPLDPETTLGPMVRPGAAEFVRGQITDAVRAGARSLIDEAEFPASRPGTAYLSPHVLTDVTHKMSLMRDETFGPAVGIMKVASDEDALQLMNDSPYGLTASIWTEDEEAAIRLGDGIETGTVFMNRCDYLDPYLAWTGVRDSGHGCTLSPFGYEALTRPKSYHLRTKT